MKLTKNQPICIIIPAYNEEKSIKYVINSIQKVNKKFAIVVVNDGSTDKTRFIAEKLNVVIVNHPFNLGIGGAVQTGLKYACENGFDLAIQVDADGQHDPKYIPKLLKNLKKDIDMVIGSRYIKPTKYKTPILRLIGIKIFSQLIYWTCSERIYDSTSGYRAFSKKAIDFFSNYYPQEFPEPRSIVTFLKNKYKIKEISVEAKERIAGKSSVSLLYAIYFMFSISIAILLESARARKIAHE